MEKANFFLDPMQRRDQQSELCKSLFFSVRVSGTHFGIGRARPKWTRTKPRPTFGHSNQTQPRQNFGTTYCNSYSYFD